MAPALRTPAVTAMPPPGDLGQSTAIENAPILHEIASLLRGLEVAMSRVRSNVSTTPRASGNSSAQAFYAPDLRYPEEGHIFSAHDTSKSKPFNGLIKGINLWARDHGYAVTTNRSKRTSGKRWRVVINCCRAGQPRYEVPDATEKEIQERKEAGLRKPYKKRGSTRCNCPFTFNLVETMSDSLEFEVRYTRQGTPAHNHEPLESWAAVHQTRILPVALQEQRDKCLQQGYTASQVLKQLQVEGVDYLLKSDIHNRRRDIYRQTLGGLSATNFIVQDLDSRGVPAFSDVHNHQLRQLFISFKPALDLRGRQLDFIIFDSTFRTNCYNMPMAHFVAMTANRRPYTLAVSFLNGESEQNYEWSLRRLQDLGVYSPVWVVDAEVAESNAIRKVYPNVTIILCRWHVFEAIEHRVHNTENISDDEEWQSFKEGFRKVVDTVSTEDLVSEWFKFQRQWKTTHPGVIRYLQETWLCDGRKQSLCRAYFTHVAHFDMITTSPYVHWNYVLLAMM
jgi:hypothetical protein